MYIGSVPIYIYLSKLTTVPSMISSLPHLQLRNVGINTVRIRLKRRKPSVSTLTSTSPSLLPSQFPSLIQATSNMQPPTRVSDSRTLSRIPSALLVVEMLSRLTAQCTASLLSYTCSMHVCGVRVHTAMSVGQQAGCVAWGRIRGTLLKMGFWEISFRLIRIVTHFALSHRLRLAGFHFTCDA